MGLGQRIKRLERVSRGASCPACGFGPNSKPDDRPLRVEYRIDGKPGAPRPAPCAACGEPLFTTVVVAFD